MDSFDGGVIPTGQSTNEDLTGLGTWYILCKITDANCISNKNKNNN
jgi:hypothetical protein